MADVLHRTTLELKKSVHTPDVPAAIWVINPNLTAVAGIPPAYWKINPDDSVVEMTQTEKDAVDAAELDTHKAIKFAEINKRTGELIEQGFEFPAGSGAFFSLSDHAQRNLIGLDSARDDSRFTWPLKWNRKDDKNGALNITDSISARNFFLTAVGAVRAHRDSGTELKDQVRAATTKAAVDAVVDTR